MLQSRSRQAATITRLPQPISQYSFKVKVKAGDNWLIPGRKGSGKTWFTKELVRQIGSLYKDMHVYVLDIKLRDFNDYPGIVRNDYAPSLISGTSQDGEKNVQVWQPIHRIPDEIETWLSRIMNDAPAVVHINEGIALQYTRNWKSETFEAMQKLGRDLPITTCVETQDLIKMPHSILSQADHCARFSLRHPYEKSLLKSVLGPVDEPQDRYGFWYVNVEDAGMPVYFPSMQEFFGI